MKSPILALVFFSALLGIAGRAEADTIDFSFISTPNSAGTYVDASGTLTGNLTYLSDPNDLNILMVDAGTISVVSNVSPTPFAPGVEPLIPELNGSSNISWSPGGFLFSQSSTGVKVSDVGEIAGCAVCFDMLGNPADGGSFYLGLDASGVNGAPDNSGIFASDGGTHGYLYGIGGTMTLFGQVGDYALTPEPPGWLLLGSGILVLGLLSYRRLLSALNIP